MQAYIRFIAICFFLASALSASAQYAAQLATAYADLEVFETPMALSLKKGVKKRHIEQMTNPQLKEAARHLLAGEYDPAYRHAAYQAHLDPYALGRQLMIGDGYSKFENITGVYLPKGKHTILVDGMVPGKRISLVVPNWNRRTTRAGGLAMRWAMCTSCALISTGAAWAR